MWMLILQVVQLFFMLPKIWDTIKIIMEIIKLLKTKEEKAEAKKQLKAILSKYTKVDRKNKQQVMERGQSLKEELEAFSVELKKKVG